MIPPFHIDTMARERLLLPPGGSCHLNPVREQMTEEESGQKS